MKQAPTTWYDRLIKFLLDNGFCMGKVDTTLFIKRKGKNICIDDIIFGATNESLCEESINLIKEELETSMMGGLTFFLRLQPIKVYSPTIQIWE